MAFEQKDKNKIRIEQYIQCAEDVRHYNTGLWQITSINITVAGVMIGLAFQFLSGIYRIAPLLLAFFLSLALTITFSKYIFFQLGRATFMKQIEKNFEVEGVPYSSEDIADFLKVKGRSVDAPVKWFVGRKANSWLTSLMMGVTIVLLVLTIVSPFMPLL